MPVPVPVPVPVTGPDSAQAPARPRLPSVPHTPTSPFVSLAPPSPATETGVGVARTCGAAPLGYGNERKCRPGVRRGTIGRRIGAEMFPECAEIHRWATEWGRSVPRACDAAPLGYGNERKCCPGVLRGTVGRRIVAEMFPERATRHRWATERGRSVPRACAAAPLGDGIGRKCRPGVRRGAVRRRNGAEMSPERVVMPRWATEWGRSVLRACGAAPLGDGNGRKCRPSVWSVPCV